MVPSKKMAVKSPPPVTDGEGIPIATVRGIIHYHYMT